MPGHPYPIGDMHVRDEELAAFPRTRGEIAQHVASYYAMIAHLDDQVGRILEALEESGQAENTIVALVGDNGLAVGQHGLVGKQNLYEHSSGVPFVLVGPGIAHGSSGALTYIHDLFPTLCEISGIDVPESVTARSLAPEIAEAAGRRPHRDAVPKRKLLVTSYGVGSSDPLKDGQMRAVTDGRYKLIHSKFQESDVTRLYDLDADPWELTDLSQDPKLGTLRRELESELSGAW
jgi:arylsulfatase A-like enzyme